MSDFAYDMRIYIYISNPEPQVLLRQVIHATNTIIERKPFNIYDHQIVMLCHKIYSQNTKKDRQ